MALIWTALTPRELDPLFLRFEPRRDAEPIASTYFLTQFQHRVHAINLWPRHRAQSILLASDMADHCDLM